MKKKTFEELKARRLKANDDLGKLYEEASGRELTQEEQIREINLTREIKQCEREMDRINIENRHMASVQENRIREAGERLREVLRESRDGKSVRTITLSPYPAGATTDTNIAASGAIELTIHEIIPTLHEGLGLPTGLRTVTGVIGNEVWPVSVNDVEMEEVGEIAAISEQNLSFSNIIPTPRRTGLCVSVSNAAIDNAAFDLMAFIQTKFTIALRTYLAKKIYSQAKWNGNKGPFSGLTPKSITLGVNAYKNILKAVAEFSDKGFFEGHVCLSMDRVTEATLKATPKIAGAAGGFVIENGLCCGYPYTVSHYVDTELNEDDELVATTDRFLEIGYWEWFALQQHGEVRMTIDAFSAEVAKQNVTKIVMNTAWSMTDLSVYINGGEPQIVNGEKVYPTQAFAIYKIVEEVTAVPQAPEE